jgi:hypothetical protein
MYRDMAVFYETVLPFFAHRQIPYEINMTDHYGELERGQLDGELRHMSDSDLAEVFEASVRSDDAEGVKVFGAELRRRGAGDNKQ